MPQQKGWLLGGLGECAPAREGNPAMAAKYMSEHMPRYVRGKAAYKERWAWQVLAESGRGLLTPGSQQIGAQPATKTAINSGICLIWYTWYTSIIILGLVSSGSWFERASTVHFSTSPRWLKPAVSSQLFSWSGAWFSTSINQPSQFLVEHVEHPNITNICLVYRQTFRLTRPSTEMGQELSQLGNNMDFYAVAAPRLRGRKCAFSMRAAARVTMETVQELDAPWYNSSSQQLQTWEQKGALKTTLVRLTCRSNTSNTSNS